MTGRTLTHTAIADFQNTVWGYYHAHARDMPWRVSHSPYFVLVSELMLQQTQVSRVIPKFEEFMRHFPDIHTLATASLADVLRAWSGLGYNRRAKFLWQAAQMVEHRYGGELPDTKESLVTLPGVGPNTAGAILAYAYNQPVVFVETNIRTVYLHHFFPASTEAITDSRLRELVEQTLDSEHPREWYWALMDYGAHLKKSVGGRLTQSRHYKKQSPLAGSLREMRGMIIRVLAEGGQASAAMQADERYPLAIAALSSEGMIERKDNNWRLTVAPDDR